jgi:hypothetical protein
MEHSPSTEDRPARRPAVRRALAHRDFRLFIGGQLISLIGTWIQGVAQPWLVYRLTGSSVLLELVGFVGQIPVLLLSPLGGSLADARSRHRIIIGTQPPRCSWPRGPAVIAPEAPR